MTGLDDKLYALYGHWVVADAVRHAALRHRLEGIPEQLTAVAEFSRFMILRTFYALLYVVVEGYRDLKLTNLEIDTLLADTSMVEALRRFRNSMFHPQGDPLSEKQTDFLYRLGSEVWIRDLHTAFEKFLEQSSPIRERVEEAKAALREHGMKL